MLSRTSRHSVRCARQQIRCQNKARLPSTRFQSTSSESGTIGTNPALVGGLAGGTAAFIAGYAWYHFSGAKTLIKTSKEAQSYLDQAKQTIAEKTPEPNAAFQWLKDTAKSYATLIPGGQDYVDSTFKKLDNIQHEHGEEFDKVVKDAYNELKEISKKGGLNVDTALEASRALQKYLNRLLELGGDVAEDILNSHPQLKERVGGSFEQLKQMGDSYGPQAKEEVNKTWEQITGLLKKGVSADSAKDISNLIQEKREKLQKLGDEAWQKGKEEAQPYLEKSPKIKELVENNTDALKKGNVSELWNLVKESASSGKTEDLQKYVEEKVNQARENGFEGLDKLSKMIPGGSDLIGQLQSLQSITQEKGKEAGNILEETVGEIKDVLQKRKKQLEELPKNGGQ